MSASEVGSILHNHTLWAEKNSSGKTSGTGARVGRYCCRGSTRLGNAITGPHTRLWWRSQKGRLFAHRLGAQASVMVFGRPPRSRL